jgi:outer membrane lipoprotein-sorting protein
MKKIIFIIIISTISTFSQNMKDDVFQSFKTKFSKLETVSFSYSIGSNSQISGSITAKKGDKYKIIFQNRIVSSDGKNIWNYDIENKSVIISKFESLKTGASIETFFFDLLNNFKPENYESQSNSKGIKMNVLTLKSLKDDKNSMEKIKLYLDKDLNISSIGMIKNYREETWQIDKLKINDKIADNYFEFEVKKDIEVIDLR